MEFFGKERFNPLGSGVMLYNVIEMISELATPSRFGFSVEVSVAVEEFFPFTFALYEAFESTVVFNVLVELLLFSCVVQSAVAFFY